MNLRHIAILAMLILTGCAPALTDARAAVNRVAELYSATEPALERQRIRDGDACFDASPPGSPAVRPCLDAVHARWKPVEVAAAATYAALVAAQGSVGAAEAGVALGRAPDLARVLAAVGQSIDAAERLESAVGAAQSAASPIATPSPTIR